MTEDLSELLFDPTEANVAMALGALKRVIGIDPATGNVHPIAEFDRLSGRAKVAALALGVSAAVQLGKRDRDAVDAATLVEWSGLAPGSVRRDLSALAKKRLLSQPGRGQCSMLDHRRVM